MTADLRTRARATWHRQTALLRTRAGRWIALLLALLGAGTAIALVTLWPHGSSTLPGTVVVSSRVVEPATVVGVAAGICPAESRPGCERVGIRLDGGPRHGASSYLYLPGDEATSRLAPGDKIRVASSTASVGGVSGELLSPSDPSQAPYSFVDFQRGVALILLTFAFAALVFLLGGRVGAISLIAAALGLALVTSFVAPAIVQGASPFGVALVGAFAAMFLAIVPLYGIGAKSLAALLGTAVSLLAIAALAVLAVHTAHITGIGSEDATLIQGLGGGRLSLQGLVIAGILSRHPGVRGVLFDQPAVVAGADADGLQIVGGSFFESVPEGGDAYLLKSVLHDWEDEPAIEILRTCRRAACPGTALLVIEREFELPATKLSDLNMLIGPGGRERTTEEYAALLAAADYELLSETPTTAAVSVFEARAI